MGRKHEESHILPWKNGVKPQMRLRGPSFLTGRQYSRLCPTLSIIERKVCCQKYSPMSRNPVLFKDSALEWTDGERLGQNAAGNHHG